MTSQKTPHTFSSDLKAIFTKVGKQIKKEHAAFKKSIGAYIKKPESRIAEFVILFLVVGILFSLFALLDGWLQTFTKAAEEQNAVVEVSVEKTEENCSVGEVEYDVSAKLVDSDMGDVKIKAYELSLETSRYTLSEEVVDFEIGADEDKVSNYDDGIIRGFIDGREQILSEQGEAKTFLKLALQKEEYEGEQKARCSLQQIDEEDDYVALLDAITDAFEKDEQYKQFIQDELMSEFSSEAIEDATASILEDEEYSDNQVAADLAENTEGDETPTKAEIMEVISNQDSIEDITVFVAEIVSQISSSRVEEIGTLASATKEMHEENYYIEVQSVNASFFAKTGDGSNFEIVELEVVGDGEWSGGSGSEDDNSGGSSSGGGSASGGASGSGSEGSTSGSGSNSGSADNEEDDERSEESSEPQRGTGAGYECKERPEKGADPAGVCGCIGEDCGFGDTDENRYDWRCCHRELSDCVNGQQSCITVPGSPEEHGGHQCEISTEPLSCSNEESGQESESRDGACTSDKPPGLPDPENEDGMPSYFLKSGSDWLRCGSNNECQGMGGEWCYGGYCGASDCDTSAQYRCSGEPSDLPDSEGGKPDCFVKDSNGWITCTNNDECDQYGAEWCYAGYCGRP